MSINAVCHEGLEALAPTHKAVFDRTERISYDLSYPWFANLLATTLGPHEKLKICLAEDEAGDIAILPMCYDATAQKPRKLRALSNFYTSLYAPISSGVATAELLSLALSPLRNEARPWDEIDFSPLSIEDGSFDALFKALRTLGMLPFKYYCFGNWYLPVGGRSYEEYHQTLPSYLKNTLKRKGKHFFADGLARLEIVVGGERLESAIACFTKVYSTSWKNEEPFPGFIPGLIRASAERGWLRLGIAYLKDEPVAAQIWIVAHGRAAIYKLAYDEKYASYSAGSILSSHMMQYVMDVDKVYEVDYLIGDDPYKKDWMSHRRERWGIIAYNSHTLPGLIGACKQSLGEVRRVCMGTWSKQCQGRT